MVFNAFEKGTATPAIDLLSWIFDSCPYEPNRPILVEGEAPEKCLSWIQIKLLVRKITAGFKAFGLKDGDCTFLLARSNIYYYPMVYGCIAAGGIHCGGSDMWSLDEAKRCAIAADVKHLVVESEFLNHALQIAEALSLDKSKIIIFDKNTEERWYSCEFGTFLTWNTLLDHGNADWKRINDPETSKRTIGMRFFTSGSSGIPKVADVSHHALIAHINQWDRVFESSKEQQIRALQYISLHYISGHAMVTTSLRLGMTLYLIRYSIQGIIEACHTFKPTLIMIDPTTATRLAKALPPDSQTLHSFRDIRCIAAAFPPELRKTLQALLHPDCIISRPYGLTEVGTIAATAPSHKDSYDPESVGYTWPGVSVKLVDSKGNEVFEYDSLGEICVKADSLLSSYYNNTQATKEAFDNDGWYRTGDVGYISMKNKQWYIVGRKKEVFKVEGDQVPPAEVEAMLVSHPDVADAAVAPIFEPNRIDPKVKAFIVPRTTGVITEKQILEFMTGKLAAYKAITGGVEFVHAVPRNALGKIMRWKLDSAAVSS